MTLPFAAHIPFVEHLGFELLRFHGGHAHLRCTLRTELTNSYGVIHGGVTMTLLDVAMAHAARSPDTEGTPPRDGVVTIEMKTTFTSPGTGRLDATARVLHRSTTLSFCEGSVHDEAGVLVAHATGTFKHMRAVPDGQRRLHHLQAPMPQAPMPQVPTPQDPSPKDHASS
jgi:uncharacterized protein (TIGR00369 family)